MMKHPTNYGYGRDLVSDCCSEEAVGVSDDLGICPRCQDHCEYIEREELDCDACHGSGEVVDYSGPVQPDYQTCRECRGTGKYHDDL